MISPFYGFTGYELWMAMMIWYFDIFDMAVEVDLKHSQAIFRIISVYWEGRKDVFRCAQVRNMEFRLFFCWFVTKCPCRMGLCRVVDVENLAGDCPTLSCIVHHCWGVSPGIGVFQRRGQREVQTQQAAAGEMILKDPGAQRSQVGLWGTHDSTEINKLDVRLRLMY